VGDFECLVVDDASPEPVQVADDPRIRVIRREHNGGPAAARNTGLDAARGRYVTFLDDDDLYAPQRLALAVEGIRRSHISICWIRYLHARPDTNRILEGDVRHTILDHFAPHLGTVTVDRDLAPRFDERLLAAEDAEWWLRMAQKAPVATIRQVGYLLRHHRTPRHLIDTTARIEGRRFLLRLHQSYFAEHPQAAAFQWKRIGVQARMKGDYALARAAFARAMALRPQVATLLQLARAVRFSSAPPPREEPISLEQ
jgi:glycosyltransferase involved in cell wall biosynthesis